MYTCKRKATIYPNPWLASHGYQECNIKRGIGTVIVSLNVSGLGTSQTLSPKNVMVVQLIVVKIVTDDTIINNWRIRANDFAWNLKCKDVLNYSVVYILVSTSNHLISFAPRRRTAICRHFERALFTTIMWLTQINLWSINIIFQMFRVEF